MYKALNEKTIAFRGSSSDTKPIGKDCSNGNVNFEISVGSTYLEIETSKVFMYKVTETTVEGVTTKTGSWVEIELSGGGGGGGTYTAGNGIDITNKAISVKLNGNSLSEDASGVKVNTTVIQPKLTAGNNISIDSSTNTISADITRTFPSTWPTTGTCKAFLEAIGADANAKVGETYQGGVAFSDLSDDLDLSNAEAEVEIINSTLSTNYKIIRLNIYSATDEPYSWARIYWWTGNPEFSTLQPWQITARAANQYTVPVATGTVNKTTGVVTFNEWGIERGVYLVNIYGTQSSSQISYTYYFAYGGYETWMTHSCDCCGTSVAALSRTLTMIRHDGQALGWDNDATIDMYKMR